MTSFTSRDAHYAAALFGFSVLCRALFLIQQPFDGLYGQDAYTYFDFAQALRVSLASGSSPPPFFWGLGYPALLMSVFALFGASAASAQAISLIMGAALAPMVYLLARMVNVGRDGAIAGGLIMALCGQAAQSSLVVMADIPALFWALLSALILYFYLRRRRSAILLVAAAICLALAILTRWMYVLLIFPSALLFAAERGSARHLAIAVLVALLVFIPQAAFSVNNPYPTFNHAWVQGWSPANAFQHDFVNVDGEFHYALPNWQFYGRAFTDSYYLAPIFVPFTLVGLLALRKRDALFFALWALLPYLFLIGIPYQNIRFPLAVVPACALLCGAGFEWVLAFLRRHSAKIGNARRPIAQWVLTGAAVAVLALGLITMLSAGQQTIGEFLNNQQRDKSAAAWAASQLADDATVFTLGLTLTLQHYTTLDTHELYYETPQTLSERAAPGSYLLINVWQIENQWQGREPQASYHYLRDERGLREVGRYGNYTLFEIMS